MQRWRLEVQGFGFTAGFSSRLRVILRGTGYQLVATGTQQAGAALK